MGLIRAISYDLTETLDFSRWHCDLDILLYLSFINKTELYINFQTLLVEFIYHTQFIENF